MPNFARRTVETPDQTIVTTPLPVAGDPLFAFTFEGADVLDFRRVLPIGRADEIEGVLLPKQLLFDPQPYGFSVVRLLDKITTQLETRTVPIGEEITFGTLTLQIESCLKNPSSQTPESTSFITVVDSIGDTDPIELFKGWMFASSPGLNALDHAIYDVWVIDCTNNSASIDS